MMQHRLPRLAARFALACALVAGVVVSAAPCRADDKPDAKKPAIPADTEVVTTASGLKYSILTPGKDGKHPKRGEKVTVHYTGWLTDGTMFDSSRTRGQPSDFVLGEVVEGWNEALALMTVGARWKLTIPGNLAYGAQGRPPMIPADATLIFDVELLSFQAMPEFRAPDPAAQKTTASGLKYEVVTEGAGERPAGNDALELRYSFWNAKGSLLDCSEKSGGTIKSTLEGMMLAFMKEGALLIKPGGRLRFEVPPELCFGAQAQGPQLPANSVTIWELELVRVMKPLPLPAFALPDEAKAKTTGSGLKYEVIEPGEGASPKMGDHVKVHYAGWLTDGTPFDSSFAKGEEVDMQLGRVIPGWNEGLQMMKPGAIYRFLIPPALAYGPRAAGPKIGPNSTLVFYIKLIKVGE